MSTTVFILGAGASKDAGAPLMSDFLDIAHELWKLGSVKESEESFSKVFAAISALQQVHSKSQLNITNVESVFGAFEMARTLQTFGKYSMEEIEGLIRAMRVVIGKTIECTVGFPIRNEQFPDPPEPYPEFTDLLDMLKRESKPPQSVAVLTFNYDMALDFALFKGSQNIDYGLANEINQDDIPLLKLHGSLNWAVCRKCEKVVPWELREYFSKFKWHFLTPGQRAFMKIGSQLDNFTHCGENVQPEPVIVPPTWNKTEYHRSISHVWHRAARELSNAENIVVIGYSMPESDAFFRYLYALGTVGDNLLKRFWVFDPESSDSVEKRFQRVLGPGAEQRFRCIRKTFSDAVGILKTALIKT